MTLDDYLTKTRKTEADFGALIGLTQGQVNRLRRGKSMPSWETVETIRVVTRGKVKADDFRSAAAA